MELVTVITPTYNRKSELKIYIILYANKQIMIF